jgi:hypothetical protein
VTVVTTLPSVESLIGGVVDYAGLFPPAELDMAMAVRNYSTYRTGEHQRVLGRFIVPATRLDEFAAAAMANMPRRRTDEAWQLSVLVGPDVVADLRTVAQFNSKQGDEARPRAAVDSIEAKAGSVDQIGALVAALPARVECFVELSMASDPSPLLHEIARRKLQAKMRTGGVTPESIPSSPDVVRYLEAALRVNVGLKATAGLHHAIRGVYPLTYKPDSPRALMHGFINVLLAAVLLREGGSEAEAVAMLDETDPEAFQFGPASARWKTRRLATDHIRAARQQFALSFGSCSFQEPIDDLRALRLL